MSAPQARHRRVSAASAASTPPNGSRKGHFNGIRSASSASATPNGEEDEDGKMKRSTRGRNPLPPSSGPLFPPLPPKVPKPKAGISATSTSSPSIRERADSPTNSDKPDVGGPATSNASLTPPPPGSEGILGDDADPAEDDDEADEERTHGALEPALAIDEKAACIPDVKVEDEREGDAEEDAEADADADATPRRSVSASERAASQSRAKRRRGEEALLLDDHLLPVEMRRTITSKRSSQKDKGDHAEAAGAGAEVEAPDAPVKVDEDVEMEEPDDEAGQGEEEQDGDEGGADGGDVTRCICQLDDTDEMMMIQCDDCNVWQHGPCMGIWADEEAPDEYYCEECRPDLHGPLKRWTRQCGRNIAFFTPPTPEDLKRLRPHNDKTPPSQSKRWTDPALMSPPPPSKPASRSHHKKEVESPVEHSAVRPPRRLPFPERPPSKSGDDKPASSGPPASSKAVASKSGAKPASSTHRGSVSPGRSLSPSTAMHSAARRRITMNSRDAMYEEEVKAAMEASRREALGLPPAEEEEGEEEITGDAVEEVEEERERKEVKKGKRKRDDDTPGSAEPSVSSAAAAAAAAVGSSKIKHPNQYTYRPKPASTAPPASVASPARRGAGTPVPSLAPPQHDHGTRRAGAIANGAITNPTLSASSVAALSWYLPEHLSSFTDLLPSAQPVALDVRSQRTLPSISRNHYHNQRYGPFTEDRDSHGKLVLPDDPPLREPAGEAETHLEPPARVKYPVKRITVGEMRKRVRTILEYVSKVQSTEDKRVERNKALGVVVKPLPKKSAKPQSSASEDDDAAAGVGAGAGDQDGDVVMGDESALDTDESSANKAAAAADDTVETTAPPAKSSTELMEELTRDLLAFQDTFAANGIISPMPPPMATFEAPLPLPIPDLTEIAPSEPVTQPEGEADVAIGADVQPETAEAGIGAPAVPESIDDALAVPDLEPDQHMSDVPALPVPDATDSTSAPALEPSAAIGTDTDVVVDKVAASDALDVYREGQVDKVVSNTDEQRVLAETAAPDPSSGIAPNQTVDVDVGADVATSTAKANGNGDGAIDKGRLDGLDVSGPAMGSEAGQTAEDQAATAAGGEGENAPADPV